MKRKSSDNDDDVQEIYGEVTEEWLKSTGLSVIRISSKSSAAAPFKGAGEFLDETDQIKYYHNLLQIIDPSTVPGDIGIYTSPSRLKKVTAATSGQVNWRKVLSSYHQTEKPIPWGKREYATLEHVFAQIKFQDLNPEFADTFALPVDGAASDEGYSPPGMQESYRAAVIACGGKPYHLGSEAKFANAAGSISGRYKDPKTGKVAWKRPDNIGIDSAYLDMDSRELEKLIELITYSKFSTDEMSRKILLATRQALLVETSSRGKGKVRLMRELMNVRARITSEIEQDKLDAEEAKKLDESNAGDDID
jgi:hypothetical protein